MTKPEEVKATSISNCKNRIDTFVKLVWQSHELLALPPFAELSSFDIIGILGIIGMRLACGLVKADFKSDSWQ